MGRPPFQPTDEQRRMVRSMAAFGNTQDQIAKVLGVCSRTVRKHFRIELDRAAVQANNQVAQSLFKKTNIDQAACQRSSGWHLSERKHGPRWAPGEWDGPRSDRAVPTEREPARGFRRSCKQQYCAKHASAYDEQPPGRDWLESLRRHQSSSGDCTADKHDSSESEPICVVSSVRCGNQ